LARGKGLEKVKEELDGNFWQQGRKGWIYPLIPGFNQTVFKAFSQFLLFFKERAAF